MCTPAQRIFYLCILLVAFDLYAPASAAPTKLGPNEVQPLLDAFKDYNDYDLHYDQRQQGKGNIRMKLDGFVFLLPLESIDLLALAALVPFEMLADVGEERRVSLKVPGSVRLRHLADKSKK